MNIWIIETEDRQGRAFLDLAEESGPKKTSHDAFLRSGQFTSNLSRRGPSQSRCHPRRRNDDARRVIRKTTQGT